MSRLSMLQARQRWLPSIQKGLERQSYVLAVILTVCFCLIAFPDVTTVVGQTVDSPIKVELSQTDEGWQLLRDGQPYRILGAGGTGSLSLLSECGGNSNRLWGVDDDTRSRLDEAHRLGISVALGIWLEHERHGFDYSDQAKVAEQTEKVLAAVKEYKDHPAVLVWGLGNEMEGSGENLLVWQHIESLAKAVKELDPAHPTMTVIAEMGGQKVTQLHQLCPSIDIVGINSYGGAMSVPQRYREQGGSKPYIVTEFGPPGAWEVGKNEIGAVLERTSTEKATIYRDAYQKFSDDQKLCLGCYAFLWGYKQEATATWFGMLLEDGKRTAAVDVMTELWSGKSVSNHCPEIEPLMLDGGSEFKPGASLNVQVKTSDPDQDKLQVTWILRSEANSYSTGGDFQETPPSFEDNLKVTDVDSVDVTLPTEDGLYRLYAYVDDGHQGAAVANVPLRVQGDTPPPGAKVNLPLTVYDEPGAEPSFISSGWMGSTDAIAMDEKCDTQPQSGTYCLKVSYSRNADWGGVVWQNPPGDWGDQLGGFDLRGAKTLSFWARGEAGGEEIKFGYGLLGREKKYFDTGSDEMKLKLTAEWKEYQFDVSSADLSRIKSGFYWVAAGQGKPLTFYLDAVKYK